MRNFILITLVILLLAVPLNAADIGVSAECAILIEASSGNVIYEKNADNRHLIASTTKIMTALVALENYDITKIVTVSEKAVGVEGSSIYLTKGEKLSMEDLLYALMLESANDAAAAIAVEVAGSVENFADMMNSKAVSIGLKNTHFTNPHGLDNSEHYSTAYDMAMLTRHALMNDTFKTIVSTYKRVIPLKGDEGSRVLLNHNKMIKLYDGVIGVKTGFTKKSGRCLVSAAERDGVTLIAVTLNAPDDWNDHRRMLDTGFSMYERVLLTYAGEMSYVIPVLNGDKEFIKCKNSDDLYAVVRIGNINITSVVEMKRFYYAPITQGSELGRVIYYNNGVEVGCAPIIADYNIENNEHKFNLWDWIIGIWKK
jgi:D-alanyl-D-alanine carboxypeptidase